MAVQERISRLRVTTSLGAWREWVATAVARDTPAGGSVDVTVTMATSGTTPPTWDSFRLSFVRDDGSGIGLAAYDLTAFPATRTFHFGASGTSGTNPRAGTVEILLLASSNQVGGAYSVESDGTPNTLPAGWSSTTDRGWIRGTTTAVQTLSNVAAGGAKNSPAQFADALHLRTVLAAPSFKGAVSAVESLTQRILDGATARRTGFPTSTTATFDSTFSGTSTFSGRVNSGFAAAAVDHVTDVTPASSGLTGQPWTVLTAVTTDTLTVDPRITVDHHLQVDDSAVATPPGSKDRTPKRFPSDALPFIAFRLVGARGDGIDGLTATETFRDAGQLLPAAVDRTLTTATLGGEAGWAPTLASTQQSKPGGAYDHTVTVTTSDASGLVTGGTETYTMLRSNPSIGRVVSGGPINVNSHVYAGGQFQAGVSLVHGGLGRRIRVVSAEVALIRLQSAGANAGFAEYLAADGVTWVPLSSADFDLDAIDFHACAETRANSNVFTRVWTDTTAWGGHDLFIAGRMVDAEGTEHVEITKEPVVGPHHDHNTPETPVNADAWLGIP